MNVQEFVKLDREAIHQLVENRFGADADGHKRRRITRWPFPGQLQLWIRDAAGTEVQVFGTCHNLNENGIGVYCERSIEIGQQVPIAIHQPEATYHGDGVVRHCTPSDGEYFVGIEFIDA
ncbi:MAG: PilZ domain-containing protein [Phycisphaerales bacterium]|nr:PilZ domain-containing protein [Phycisphaerales bacterium]